MVMFLIPGLHIDFRGGALGPDLTWAVQDAPEACADCEFGKGHLLHEFAFHRGGGICSLPRIQDAIRQCRMEGSMPPQNQGNSIPAAQSAPVVSRWQPCSMLGAHDGQQNFSLPCISVGENDGLHDEGGLQDAHLLDVRRSPQGDLPVSLSEIATHTLSW